ncbi:MAG: T9SS type A sorting domain-containing protein [Ignavibacteriaceae bacterium]|nr:T9SS type A sorting domain-containing protein [Ignavibacteriaceae bacterium]
MKSIIKFLFAIILVINSFVFSQTPILIGPPGDAVMRNHIAMHPNDPALIYTGTDRAIFRNNLIEDTIYPIETGFYDYHVTEIALPYNEHNYIYVDLYGRSLISTNYGAVWNVIYEQDTRSHFAFNPLNSDIVFMVRDRYDLWRSNDKGGTWFKLKTFNRPVWQIAVAPSDTSFIYVAVEYALYKSTNSGTDWIMTSETSRERTYRIIVNPYNKNSVYYHMDGLLYKSNDGGYTLNTLFSLDVSDFILNPLDTLNLYVAIGNPISPGAGIIKTTDEGINWFAINNGIPGEYIWGQSIILNPSNPAELYAGIGFLGVYKTTNGGNNWSLTNLAYTDVFDIYIDPEKPDHLMSGQYGFGIMQTTDDGDTWVQPQFNTPFEYLNCRDFTFNPDNKDIGFVAAHSSLIKTSDGGNSWFITNQLLGVTSVSYHPMKSNILFAGGRMDPVSPGFFVRSTDGGDSWNSLIYDFRADNFIFHPADTNIIYTEGTDINTFNGSVFKSTDLGETWIPRNSGLVHNPSGSIFQITSISILKSDPEILYCSQGKALNKSTNGGENWFQIDSTLNSLDPEVNISSILLESNRPGRIYVGSSNKGGLFLTEDDGKNWQKIYDGDVYLIKADNSIPRNIYFGTKFGIMKITDTITVSVEEIQSEVPAQYFLFQNYPNPFNPTTTIKYQIPGLDFVTLKVYDILGNEIATLVNEYKPAGSHDAEFNAAQLPSGVYFYQFKAGSFTQTKKMILLR